MLGCHVSVTSKNLVSDLQYYKDEHKLDVVQIFLGNSRSLKTPNIEVTEQTLPIETIVHTSYPVNLVSGFNRSLTRGTLDYLVSMSNLCDKLGIKHIVTHIGHVPPNSNIKESYQHLLEFLYSWEKRTKNHKTILCLENSSGSKNNRKLGDVSFVFKVIREFSNNFTRQSRVSMTFDTEHAYANSFDISNKSKIDFLLNHVSVVHLNSIPHNVEFGKHLDRHSGTLISDSKHGPESLLYIAKKCKEFNIPVILERDFELAKQDIVFIENRLKEVLNE